MLFGQYVQKLRKGAGLTQRALAESLEMDTAYLSRIENDLNGFYPQEPIIRKLIIALGIVQDQRKADQLWLLADRIPPDIKQIIMRDPAQLNAIRRRAAKKGHVNGRPKYR